MVFVLFHRGRSSLDNVEKSGGLQATLLKLKVKLQGDFQMTTLSSVSVQVNPGLTNRDSVSCVTLDDWSNPDNFSTINPGPRWNQRVTYVNALEGDGDLDRFIYVPDDPESLKSKPLPRVWPLDPDDETLHRSRLSSEVSQFIATVDEEEGLIELRVSLKRGTNKSVTGEFVYAPRHTLDYI